MPGSEPTARCALALLLSLAAMGDVAAVVERTGTTSGGSAYRIVAPGGWQSGDGLVLLQHGYRFQRVVAPGLGPSADAMLADGYAIAAPGYRQSGWAVFDAIADNQELLQIFRDEVGEPGSIIVHGESMGALIGLKLAEDPVLSERIEGVIALCPAADGMGQWDQAFDLRLVYDAVCADIAGGQLPVGDDSMPWASNLDVLADAPTDPLGIPAAVRNLPAIQACLALHVPVELRYGTRLERLRTLQAIADTSDDDMLAAQLAYALYGISDLVRSPDKLAGRNPFINRVAIDETFETDLLYSRSRGPGYVPPAIDERVVRTSSDRMARLKLSRASLPQGSATTRILAVHTSLDGIVPVQSLKFLQQRMERAELVAAVLNEATPSHCGLTQAEYDTAWRGMREWVDHPEAAAPDVEQLGNKCQQHASPGECRFDVDRTTAVLSGEAESRRLREPLLENWSLTFRGHGLRIEPVVSGGLWSLAQRPAQGIMIEELDDYVGEWDQGEQRIALAWYTWAPDNDAEPGPRWLYGVGRALGDSIHVDNLLEVRGGRFGSALEIEQVENIHWGSLQIVPVPGQPGQAMLSYQGPPAWGAGETRISLLFPAGRNFIDCLHFCIDPTPQPSNFSRTGTYFDSARPAGGWILAQKSAGYFSRDAESLLLWFTWDADGRPAWMFGIDAVDRDGLSASMQQAVSGGRFEPGYELSDVQMVDWGGLQLRSAACAERRLESIAWTSALAAFESGDVGVSRLTTPTHLDDGSRCD